MEFKEIVPFTYHAPQNMLDHLKQRLAQTRWPERETTNDWSEGVPLEKLRALVDYWRTDYDWRRCEEALNRFPQWKYWSIGPSPPASARRDRAGHVAGLAGHRPEDGLSALLRYRPRGAPSRKPRTFP